MHSSGELSRARREMIAVAVSEGVGDNDVARGCIHGHIFGNPELRRRESNRARCQAGWYRDSAQGESLLHSAAFTCRADAGADDPRQSPKCCRCLAQRKPRDALVKRGRTPRRQEDFSAVVLGAGQSLVCGTLLGRSGWRDAGLQLRL